MTEHHSRNIEIIPGTGTSLIRFGLDESQAIQILGKPDKTYVTECKTKRLQFNEYLIELSFEPENEDRLGWIEVHNSSSTLFGKKLINLQRSEIVKFVSEKLSESPVTEDYGSFVSIVFEKNWLELQFNFDLLKCINLGVLYLDGNTPAWPSPL